MSEHLVVYAVIDYEKDIACAALTQKEAEEIIRESEDGEEAYNDFANLRAWCQACHLAYDAAEHAAHARHTRRRKQQAAGQQEFETF